MPRRLVCTQACVARACVAALFLFVSANAVAQSRQEHVDTRVAMAQIIKKVDPVLPPEAAAAKVGGLVIVDATISTTGTVSQVTFLTGAEMLRPAVERAIRQWTFKPFLVNGRPSSVQVILEVNFPDPIKDEERRLSEVYRAADFACRRQRQAEPAKAVPLCEEAVRAADALPANRILERAEVALQHAFALDGAEQLDRAILEYQRTLELRRAAKEEPNASTADIHGFLGELHLELGDPRKADAEFTTAIQMFDAIDVPPASRQVYSQRVRPVLLAHAAVKRTLGDSAAAAALDARAIALGAAAPARAPSAPATRMRTVGTVEVVERMDRPMPAADLDAVLAVVKATGRNVWRVQVDAMSATVFDMPEVTSPTLRRGNIGYVNCRDNNPVGDSCRDWWYGSYAGHYLQLAPPGGDADGAPTIVVSETPNMPAISDAEVVRLAAWLRARAVATPTTRTMTDIQPWPIRSVGPSFGSGGPDRIRVVLQDGDRVQLLTLAPKDGEWTVVEMR